MDYVRKPISYDAPTQDEAILKGPSWRVYEKGGSYLFTYISGEISGKEKSVNISQEDVDALREGSLDQDGVCVKYGVS